MYGKSVAMGALALAGAAHANGLGLDLDLNLGGGSKDLAQCAENKCYGSLVQANVKLNVAGICVDLLAAVSADLSALPDLAACASLDVLTAACKCVAHGGAGSGSGNGGSGSGNGGATMVSQTFPVVTMTGGDGMTSQTNADGMTSQTGADGMASMTASVTGSAVAKPTASHQEELTVSTVTTTRWKSVIDCPATVTGCSTVTSQVEVYTTTCPVSGPHATAPAGGNMPGDGGAPGGGSMPSYTVVKTMYTTKLHVVTKCSETVSNCPATTTSEVEPTGYTTLTYPAVPTLTAVPVPGMPGSGGPSSGYPTEGQPGNSPMPGTPGEGQSGNSPMPGTPGEVQQPGKGSMMPGTPSAPGYPVTNGTFPKPPSSHGTGAASPVKPTMPAAGPGYSATPVQTAGAGRVAGSGLALAAVVLAAPLLL